MWCDLRRVDGISLFHEKTFLRLACLKISPFKTRNYVQLLNVTLEKKQWSGCLCRAWCHLQSVFTCTLSSLITVILWNKMCLSVVCSHSVLLHCDSTFSFQGNYLLPAAARSLSQMQSLLAMVHMWPPSPSRRQTRSSWGMHEFRWRHHKPLAPGPGNALGLLTPWASGILLICKFAPLALLSIWELLISF